MVSIIMVSHFLNTFFILLFLILGFTKYFFAKLVFTKYFLQKLVFIKYFLQKLVLQKYSSCIIIEKCIFCTPFIFLKFVLHILILFLLILLIVIKTLFFKYINNLEEEIKNEI